MGNIRTGVRSHSPHLDGHKIGDTHPMLGYGAPCKCFQTNFLTENYTGKQCRSAGEWLSWSRYLEYCWTYFPLEVPKLLKRILSVFRILFAYLEVFVNGKIWVLHGFISIQQTEVISITSQIGFIKCVTIPYNSYYLSYWIWLKVP